MSILDNIYNQLDAKIDIEVDLFNREIISVLKKTEALALVRLKDLDQSNVLQYDLIWRDILNEAGYYDLIRSYVNSSYDSIYKDLNAMFAEVGLSAALSSDDIQALNALKQIDIQYFAALGDDVGLTLKRKLANYVVGGLSADDLALQLKRDLSNTDLERYANTYAQTSISKYNQSVINMKSQEFDGVHIYVGVNDSKTRDFCKCVLNQNKYYNNADKIQLENDSRRQYNCRHLFLKVSQEYAIDNGYSSGVASC